MITRRPFLSLSALAMLALLTAPPPVLGQHSARLQAGLAAAAIETSVEGNRLLVALTIENAGRTTALDVRVTRVVLGGVRHVTSLPQVLGDLAPGESGVAQLAFSFDALNQDRVYRVVVGGTYRIGTGPRQGFEVNRVITWQEGEGEREALQVDVPPGFADGASFPPDNRGFRPDDANREEDEPYFPVPLGRVIGDMTPDVAPALLLPAVGGAPEFEGPALLAANQPVRFFRTATQNVQDRITDLFPWDPSGATVQRTRQLTNIVFLTGNTYALLSTDGGGTFARIDPTTVFPNGADGGLCCDQVVQYIPQIDRFIWFMQFKRGAGTNTNRIRLASASPAQIIASNGTQWTYWDMTSATFNLGNNWMDYPDVSFTDGFLHISIDRVSQGLFIIRAPLSEIRDSLTLHLLYTDPANGSVAYGGHLTQDAPDRAYWFGHVTTSSLRIFRWLDSSTSYSWRTIDVNSWNNSDYATNAPNGVNWLDFGFGRGAIRGATYTGSVDLPVVGKAHLLKIAWSAGRGGGFAQPYVRLLDLVDIGGSFTKLAERQIWNSNYAFQHPFMTTNADGEVAISLGYGGPSNHATPVVGFVGDSTLFYAGHSTTTISRWGDYSAVRKHGGNPRRLAVSNYFLQSAAESGVTGGRVVHQYILFGRDDSIQLTSER